MGHVAAQPAVKQKWAMVERPAIRSPGCQSVGVPDAVRSPARQRLKPVPSSNETVRAGNRHPLGASPGRTGGQAFPNRGTDHAGGNRRCGDAQRAGQTHHRPGRRQCAQRFPRRFRPPIRHRRVMPVVMAQNGTTWHHFGRCQWVVGSCKLLASNSSRRRAHRFHRFHVRVG